MAQPPHEGATVPRKDYLKTAFESLEEGIKKDLEDLRDKFDKKTKRAIDDLIEKKPDGVPDDLLSETKTMLTALRHDDYHKLTIKEKGDLQRWALGKRLESNTVEELLNMKAKHQSQEDAEAGANGETLMTLDEQLVVCGEQKKIAELKQKVFKFLGKEIKLNSLWANIVDTVNKLKSVGDTAASSNQTAGLVWGIFKVLLQFAVMSEKGAEAALSGMQTAVNAIQRAATYEKHIYDPAGHQTLGQSATEPFETCLISTYQRVFKFLVLASKCFTKNKASLCWYVFWSDKDILEFEQDIFKYEQKLFQDAAIKSLIDQGSKESVIHDLVKDMSDHILETQGGIVEVLSQQSGVALVLQSLRSKVNDIQRLVRKNCLDFTRDEILGWFSAARVEDHHRSAKDKRTEDTAEWILKKQQYLDWASDSGPSLLWIKGISGAGKTTIISRLVDMYHESTETADSFAQPHIAYFYCKRDAADRRFSEDIFRSFIRQLASAYHPLPGGLAKTYREKSPKSSLSAKLYEEDYESLLEELIPGTTETVLILDALDECIGENTRSGNEIGKVLKTLSRLLHKKLPIKIVAASRYDKRIEHDFINKHMIEISADDNSSDIEKMVMARMNDYNLTDPADEINEDLQEEILKVFNEKSQGKFQWATLHIDHIIDGLTDGDISGTLGVEEMLGDLPEGLADTYNQILHRINEVPPLTNTSQRRQKERAIRALKWLLAMGTCDENVLIAAVFQRLEGQPGDYPNRVEGDASYILTACQHLVTIQDGKFRFSHLSVQEYLESHQPELVSTCHYDVAKVCTSVLFRYRTGQDAMEPWAYHCQNLVFPLPLLDGKQSSMNELWHFASNQWHEHFKKVHFPAQQEDIETIIDNSFPSAFANWIGVRVAGFTSLEKSFFTRNYEKSYKELSSFLWESLSGRLWAEPLTLLVAPRVGFTVVIDTAFTCGVLNKLQPVVKKNMLRQNSLGGDESPRQDSQRLLYQLFQSIVDSESEWALTIREMYGIISPIKLAGQLVERGYITNSEEFLALCDAFFHWRQAMSDPRSKEKKTIAGFESLFSKTPDQDQHAEQCYGELARLTLLNICLEEQPELQNFLFERFPDINKIQYNHLVPPVGFDMDLALARVAAGSDVRYIGLLLSHGANKDAVTPEGTPLLAALSNEMIENAQALLDAEADMKGVNLHPAEGYGNITIMACSVQDPGLFQFLRKHHAIDMDSVTDTGTCLTPLIAACLHGHIDRLNVLLTMGVDITRSLATGIYANALCAAVDGQSMRAIRQLLRRNVPKEDALEIWRKNHLEASKPDYSASISSKCQTLLSWLTVLFLQDHQEESLMEGDTGVTGCNEIGGCIDEPDNFFWDGNGDSGEEDEFSEGESDEYGVSGTNHGEDQSDESEDPEQHQEQEREHHRIDSDSEDGTERDPTLLHTAIRDNGDVRAPSDDEVFKHIKDLISWLHQHCVQEPLVVQRDLAETFGFSFLEQNDSLGVGLVRNALLKGFQNAVHLTNKQRTLNEITKTWVRFLDQAEDSTGLAIAFENAFDKGDSVELDRLHAERERLANGGVWQG